MVPEIVLDVVLQWWKYKIPRTGAAELQYQAGGQGEAVEIHDFLDCISA